MTTNVSSFLIVFREALEAALVISIIAVYLAKIGKRKYNKYLWWGSASAILISGVLGVAIWIFYGSLSGIYKEVFEGMASLTATIVLTSMIIWMTKNAKKIKQELHKKIDVAVTSGQLIGIAALAFIVVFREGLETVLFLTALITMDLTGTMVGSIIGFIAVIILAVLMWQGMYRLNISKFFKATSIILMIFAAGLTAYGIHELNEAGVIPPIIEHVWDINPPINPDGTYPLYHERGFIGLVLKSLLGYNGNPSLTEVFGYIGYWIIIGLYIFKRFFYRKEPIEMATKVARAHHIH